MGNPNRRAKTAAALTIKTSASTSIAGNDGANSPKTPPREENKSGFGTKTDKQSSGGMENKKLDKGKGKAIEVESPPSIIAPKPVRPIKTLAFKSYKTGSLITDNFEPVPIPTTMSPFPPPKASPLNPNSPSFVPTPPRVPAPTPYENTTRRLSSHSVQEPKALIHSIPSQAPFTPPQQIAQMQVSTPGAPQQLSIQRAPVQAPKVIRPPPIAPRMRMHNLGQNFNDLELQSPQRPNRPHVRAKVGNLSQIMERYPTPPPLEMAALPARAPKTFLAKRDNNRKDIVISETGIKRNIARVTERYLPNGAPFQTFSDEFDEEKYNFLEALAKMTKEEREEFVSKSCVEICIPLMSQEDEEAELVAKKLPAIKGEGTSSSSTGSAAKKPSPIPKLITVLRSLPADLITSTQKLTVTLQFPQFTHDPSLQIITPTSPRAAPPSRQNLMRGNSTHAVSVDTSYQEAANFDMMTKVIGEIFKFKGLKKLDVVLAPPSNMRTPMTLPQLNCVLPFYDLEFTGWKIWWQTTFMSRPESLRSWPLDYLNKERDRICFEREEKLANMVFITKSIAPVAASLRC